jgi:DNA modification methylase
LKTKEDFPLLIKYRKISELKPFKRNARTHSKHQIRQIVESIRRFGFTNPVLIDSDDRIVAGHGRVQAASIRGMTEIPTIRLENLTEDQIHAYVLADNKLAENAGWDPSILAIELQHLLTIDDPDFDITVTGFEVAEIDSILEDEAEDPAPDEEFFDPVSGEPPVTELRDLWLLGQHRIFCGNSLDEVTYEKLLVQRRPAMIFTDPPFNVKINGHVTGKGKLRHREFAMASGEMTESEYASFLNNSLGLLSRYSGNNSLHYLCIDWRHVADLIAAGKQTYDEFMNLCVWTKDNAGMGSLYRSQHELVLVFRKGKGPHRNNVQLGRFGRNRTNVWRYPGVHTLSKQGDEGNLLALHPTVKPVAMVADAILDCTARGEIVLDSFLGSGTTLMAAERVGRVCCGIEIDPRYVDVAIRRWQKQTGEKAVHAQSNARFDDVEPRKDVHHV